MAESVLPDFKHIFLRGVGSTKHEHQWVLQCREYKFKESPWLSLGNCLQVKTRKKRGEWKGMMETRKFVRWWFLPREKKMSLGKESWHVQDLQRTQELGAIGRVTSDLWECIATKGWRWKPHSRELQEEWLMTKYGEKHTLIWEASSWKEVEGKGDQAMFSQVKGNLFICKDVAQTIRAHWIAQMLSHFFLVHFAKRLGICGYSWPWTMSRGDM